jgi:DNA-binding transcriptional ArsR family regulator
VLHGSWKCFISRYRNSLDQYTVSKHLRVLERARLITRGREAQWRPCQLEAGPLREVADWTAGYSRFWEKSFDRLDGYLEELQATHREAAGKEKGKARAKKRQ